MLAGVNDSIALAEQLAALLRDRPAKVNLIPFNPFEGNVFERSAADDHPSIPGAPASKGLVTTIRKTRGDDIDAACGQLAGKVRDRLRVRLGDKKARPAVA